VALASNPRIVDMKFNRSRIAEGDAKKMCDGLPAVQTIIRPQTGTLRGMTARDCRTFAKIELDRLSPKPAHDLLWISKCECVLIGRNLSGIFHKAL
jgi:hypothetical protein